MIETAVVAERFASFKPGYRLLECEPAALPHFSITARAVWQERKGLPPIDEYILGAIDAAVVTPEEIATFLGLDDELVTRSLARLWQRDLVDHSTEGNALRLRLTKIGQRALEELTEVRPREGEVWFVFDRLAWRPASVPSHHLIQPKDARDAGMRQIAPRKGKKEVRPDAGELALPAVERALKESMGALFAGADLLVIKQVDRGEAKFLPCHLLIFESVDRAEHAFEIAIDGRLHADATAAVEAQGGVSHLGLQFAAAAAADPVELAPVKAVAARSHQPIASLDAIDDLRRESMIVEVSAEAQAQVKGKDPLTGRPASVDALEARNLDTFEHPPFLEEAMTTARKRLLITSPWVKNGVVNKAFAERLERLARKRVQIHIGYGITPGAGDCHPEALARLQKLHERYDNVTVGCLGDTHSKILIWDDNQIVTSFNWLSFRGDQDRTYRQETGILLKNNHAGINALHAEQRAAIEMVAPKAAPDRESQRLRR